MTETNTTGSQQNNPMRKAVWGIAAFALLLPLIAMQFTSEVDWDVADFVVFGIMLLAVCGGYEFATRLTGNQVYRLAVGIALMGAFLLVWINGAVGIIGNEENSVNGVFFAIPATAIFGALLVRFKAQGMARVMVATAVVQASVAVIAAVAGWGNTFIITGVFVAVWLTSAHLFRKAAKEDLP